MPPPQSFQPHNGSPLGDSSVLPELSHATAIPSKGNGLIATTFLDFQDAIVRLHGFPNSTIFAWRTHYRQAGPLSPIIHLSPELRQALHDLDCWPAGWVLTWLDITRSNVFDGPLSLQSHEDPNEDLVADNSLGQWPSFSSSHSIMTTLANASDQESVNISRETSIGPHDSPVDGPRPHNHMCYACKKKIKGCVDFKRHLSEHYVRWYCIPQNSVQDTENGSRCRVCNVPNPDPEHLNQHNALTSTGCVGSHFSRKLTLIQHPQRYHPKKRDDVNDYSTLAERSRYTGGRKYFACGFCVSGFHTLDSQISHIHDMHYRSSTQPSGYDAKKVILGLLSMNEYWRDLRVANSSLQDSLFTWNAAIVAKLQLRLEMNEESAYALYTAAFDQCNYGTSKACHSESMPGTISTNPQTETSQSMPLLQSPQPWFPQPSSSHQGSTGHSQASSMTPPGAQPVQTTRSVDESDFTNFYCSQLVQQTGS